MTQLYDNPYVGPRTFTRQEGDRFFGREREARDLFSLVVSERLTLFYAQSGAGKSSLINTRLIPQLQEAGFAVLPVGRVSGELPEGISQVSNIFVFNLMLSLDQGEHDPHRFIHLPLTDFLARLTSDDGQHYYYYEAEALRLSPLQRSQHEVEAEIYAEVPSVLIIDQFEEIIISHSTRWPERAGFFRQLDEAMAANPLLWVVLALREDFVAALDPYAALVASKLRARFYMQRMGYEAALEAVKEPARLGGRPFASGVAESLVDNLRQIRVQSQAPEIRLGEFIEPVQLQVVCYQLWERLKEQPLAEITQQDLQELGDVDRALAQFYEQAVADVINRIQVSEIELRHWFEHELITEAGTRGVVYRGKKQTGELPNTAVDLLAAKYLLRAEVRTGGTWYELVHDRFIEPILQSNLAWRLQQPLIQVAQAWADSGRQESKLLEGQQLNEALSTDWQVLGSLVEEFLVASQAAQKARDEALRVEKEIQRQRELEQAQALAEAQQKLIEEQRRANVRLRQRAVWLGLIGAVAILLALAAVIFGIQSNENAARARSNFALAATQFAEARAAQATAEAERQAAQANADYAQKLLKEQQTIDVAIPDSTAVSAEATAQALATQAARLEARLTAQAIPTRGDSPTETPTPVPATVSLSGSDTPIPEIYPTATARPTAIPNTAATATVVALEVQVAQVRATQTAVAAIVVCPAEAQGEFVAVWNKYKARLGCPIQSNPVGGFFAEQLFQNGTMVWSQLLDLYVVLISSESAGTWQIVHEREITWPVNMSGPSCERNVPADLVQPVRGFGGIWCANPDIQQGIGWGLAPERGVENNLLQEFVTGAILRASNGAIYVLFGDDHSYVRER